MARDLAETRRAAEPLRAITPGQDGTALVVVYRDDIHDAKTASLFALGLRLTGLEPVVAVPNRRERRAARYAEAFGIDRAIFQDTLELTDAERFEISTVEEELLGGGLSFEVVKAWRFRGFDAGSHVLSTLIRVTFNGAPDLEVAEYRDAIAPILHEVLVNYVLADRLLTSTAPAVVLVEEAQYSTNGPLVDVAVARRIDVIQTQSTWRDDAFISKRLTAETRRVNPKSVAAATLTRLEAEEPWSPALDRELDADFSQRYGGAWVLGAQFQPDTEPRSGAQIVDELGLDPRRPTAVVFAHVLWDASLFYGVDLYDNYTDWLVQTVGAACANDRVNWIVKAHPSNVFRTAHGDVSGESAEVTLVLRRYPSLPAHVQLLLPDTKISTLSLYEFADYGLTVRGTPGLEMACFGKPVLTAGTGTYAGLGFTYDSSSRSEHLERVANLHQYGPLPAEMTLLARRHAHTLFLRRAWVPTSFTNRFDFPERGWHPLDRNVQVLARSVDELRADTALDEWAHWVRESHDVDYLPPISEFAAHG